MSQPTLIRTTMFQVHDPAHFPMMVDLYKTMNETAQKVSSGGSSMSWH